MSPKFTNKEAKEARLEDRYYEEDDKQEKKKHKKKIKDNARESKNIDKRP
jgi:hypothetical protein